MEPQLQQLPLPEKISLFVAEHRSLVTVACVALGLAALFFGYRAYTAERTISFEGVALSERDSSFAEAELAERNRAFESRQASAPVQGSRMAIIPDEDVVGLAEPEQSPMEMLQAVAMGNKEQPAAVTLSDKDLSAVIYPSAPQEPGLAVSSSALDDIDARNRKAVVSAPVSHLVFSDPDSYDSFRRLHPSSTLPRVFDFSRQRMAVLVSASRLPSRIFEVVGTDSSGASVVVRYRVNPLQASGRGPDNFAFAVFEPGSKPVVLEQAE